MQGLRIRTVATRGDALSHAWPRWSPLLVWAVACVIATAGLVALQHRLLRGHPDPRWIELYHFGPALAVGVLLLVFRDHHHRPDLALGGRPTARGLSLGVVALLVGGVIVVTAMAARDTLIGERTALPEVALPMIVAVGTAIVTALGEETAWRAYLQPELEQRWGPLPSAIGVGVIWGVWSALARNPGPEHAAAFALTAIAVSVAIRALLRFSHGHGLALATLCHAALNVGALLVLPGQGDERITAWALALAATVVAGALWLASCFRPAADSGEADETDDGDDELDDDQLDEPSIGLGWMWRSSADDRGPDDDESDDTEDTATTGYDSRAS